MQGGVVTALILVSALTSTFWGSVWVGTLGEVCSVLVLDTIFGRSGASCDSVPEFYAVAACSNCRYLNENSLDGKIPTELASLTSLMQL